MSAQIKVKKMTATQVRSRFGAVTSMTGECVAIQVTRRGKPEAYILSPAAYTLLRGIDDLVAQMQEPRNIKVAKGLMTIDTRKLRALLSRRT